ncbi:MAG: hypothetical protein AAFV71_09225 [Cyanobacteria bacterium J06633_8]
MSLYLTKLAVAAAVVASTVGLSVDSAKAQLELPLVEHSGDSNFKGDPNNELQLRASFNIDTGKSFSDAIEDFSLVNSDNGTTLFSSAVSSVEQRELLTNKSELEGFLNNLELNKFEIDRDDVFARIPNGEEPIAAYVLNLNNDLNPNEQAKLALFYDDTNAKPMVTGGLQGLVDSPQGTVRYAGTETVPGVLIRDFRDGIDNPEQIVDGRTVDLFGVGIDTTSSKPFSVTVRKSNQGSVTVPEPTTGNSLLIAGAFGGLLILKRNQGIKK